MKNDTFLRSYLFCINQNPTTFEMKIHFEDSFFLLFKLRKSWMDCFVNQNKQHLSVATASKLSPPVFITFHTSKLRIYGDKKVVILREILFHTCPLVGSVEHFVYQTNNLSFTHLPLKNCQNFIGKNWKNYCSVENSIPLRVIIRCAIMG